MVLGDFDNNGVQELVISAPGHSTFGSVYVTFPTFKSSSIQDHPHKILRGILETGARFGNGIAVVDWNRDGIDDLAVSSPGLGGLKGLYQDGGIFIFLGGKNGLTDYSVFINGSLSRVPPTDEIVDDRINYYGENLVGVDIDEDGFKDLVMLSPHATPIISGVQRGSVQGFLSSNRDRDGKGVLSYSDADWTLTGTGDYDLFGTDVTFFGKTMMIGAPGFNSRGGVYGYDFSNPFLPQFQFLWKGEEDFASFGYHLNSNSQG